MKAIPKQCEVLVIGGGPAGSVASALLRQKGYHVVLLEKAKHPRRLVGESLIPHFWKYCDLIGASERIRKEGFVAKNGGVVLWNGKARRVRFKDFGFSRSGLHVERDAFDKILLDVSREKGTEVFERVVVHEVDPGDSQGCAAIYEDLETGEKGKLQARYIIDASGQRAVVARQFGLRKFDSAFRFVSIWGYFAGGSYVTVEGALHPVADRFDTPPATFVASLGDWGWAWHIVLRKSTSVGVVIPTSWIQGLRQEGRALREKFLKLLSDTPPLYRLLEGAELIPEELNLIRDYSYKPTRLVLGNCFLVGDAAGFVDPINSAGVVFSMHSAYLAAWAVDLSFRYPTKQPHYAELYEDQCRARLNGFRLLTLPGSARPSEDFDYAKKAIRLNSADENRLMFSASVLIDRSEGVEKVLHEAGFELQEGSETVFLRELGLQS